MPKSFRRPDLLLSDRARSLRIHAIGWRCRISYPSSCFDIIDEFATMSHWCCHHGAATNDELQSVTTHLSLCRNAFLAGLIPPAGLDGRA
jgi:hypothetical protein